MTKGNIWTIEPLPLPSFFNPERVGEIWPVPYMERFFQALEWTKKYNIPSAATDRTKIAYVGIDNQITFCFPPPWGQLSVTGAIEDSRRVCEFIYRYLHLITKVFMTLDTHTTWQIFHPTFLVNTKTGKHPNPGTLISNDEVQKGEWTVTAEAAFAIMGDTNKLKLLKQHLLYYSQKLSDGGKYPLIIWPFHAMLGGIGHALVPAIEETMFFHSVARGSQPSLEAKGGHPLTEAYSPFEEEVTTTFDGTRICQTNPNLVKTIMDYDAIIIGGQAKSHCLRAAIIYLLEMFQKKDAALLRKIYLVEDHTSPVIIPGVIDFTEQANEAFAKFAAVGMNVVKSTMPIEDWPGMAAILTSS